MRSYVTTHWLDYHNTHAIVCTGYYTSCCIQHTWKQAARCTTLHAPKYMLKYTLEYTPGCTWQYTPKEALKVLLSKHTSKHTLNYAANCTWWHTPSLLDCTLQCMLSRHSQVHHQVVLMYSSQHTLRYPPSCTRAAGHGEVSSWWHMVSRVWWMVGGMWQVASGRVQAAYITQNHDVGQYGCQNLIFCMATMTRSHDASRSWCW